jgi:ATP-dependent Clp protease ATP-binding subunit ClpB
MYLTEYPASEVARLVLRMAAQVAKGYTHAAYAPEHLLHALLQAEIGLHPMLQQLDKVPARLQGWVEPMLVKMPKSMRTVSTPAPDERSLSVFKEAQKLCLRYSDDEITPLHLLEALCTPEVAFKAELLRRFPLALYEVIDWRESQIRLPTPNNNHGKSASVAGTPVKTAHPSQAQKDSVGLQALQAYCEDWSALARQDKIDPVIAREKEIKQLIEILGKRISPNALIIGEPGVGKTALVGGLALKILQGDVPEKLKDATLFELDLGGRLVAGAYKGEVEERLKSVLKGIKSFEGKAILFVDEIHILLDEKGSVGSGVVNLLKPELARGEITLIGATTLDEYRRFIEKDAAFKRRFSLLNVEAPEEADAVLMIEGLLPKYEKFHGLTVEKEAIPEAVRLAKKYVTEKFLPVSAIESVDFAMSCAKQMNANAATVLQNIENQLVELAKSNPDKKVVQKFWQTAKNQISELLIGRLDNSDVNGAVEEVKALLEQLKTWSLTPKTMIDKEDLAAITAYRTGIPIGKLKSKDRERFQNLEAFLKKRVVGQDHVIEQVAHGLKTFRVNLKEPKDPGAIFFFTGPTGTGKTELAKAIAELLFDDENALIRFDMSEFQEAHSVAAMIGAPHGYVGFEQGGLLVNKVRQNPYSVVLFDEIEKAHPDIYGIFLQMLTDSRLHDKQGKMADFSNVIIIFTSNAGADAIIESFDAGKIPNTETLKALLRSTRKFKDEFLGRVDSQILPFAPISEPVADLILKIHLNKFKQILESQQNIKLTVSDSAKEYLINKGFSKRFGARPLRNTIKTYLTPPISDKIITGELVSGNTITADTDVDGQLIWVITNT